MLADLTRFACAGLRSVLSSGRESVSLRASREPRAGVKRVAVIGACLAASRINVWATRRPSSKHGRVTFRSSMCVSADSDNQVPLRAAVFPDRYRNGKGGHRIGSHCVRTSGTYALARHEAPIRQANAGCARRSLARLFSPLPARLYQLPTVPGFGAVQQHPGTPAQPSSTRVHRAIHVKGGCLDAHWGT